MASLWNSATHLLSPMPWNFSSVLQSCGTTSPARDVKLCLGASRGSPVRVTFTTFFRRCWILRSPLTSCGSGSVWLFRNTGKDDSPDYKITANSGELADVDPCLPRRDSARAAAHLLIRRRCARCSGLARARTVATEIHL